MYPIQKYLDNGSRSQNFISGKRRLFECAVTKMIGL